MSKGFAGFKHTDETKEKIRQAQLGRKHAPRSEEYRNKLSERFKGRRISDETKRKLSEAMKGRPSPRKGVHLSEETKEKLRLANTGKNVTEETKNKISKALKGRAFSEEHKIKIGVAKVGNTNWLGRKHSEETKHKISESQKRERGSNWMGGKSFEKYGFDWTNELKTLIRKRDFFKCQICGERGWQVHHIDYEKHNCNSINLITLCKSCHCRTNHNREYWIDFFSKLNEKINYAVVNNNSFVP